MTYLPSDEITLEQTNKMYAHVFTEEEVCIADTMDKLSDAELKVWAKKNVDELKKVATTDSHCTSPYDAAKIYAARWLLERRKKRVVFRLGC